MTPDRPLGTPATRPTNPPPAQIQLSGQGLRVQPHAELPLDVRHLEADLVDLTPADPLALRRGEFQVRVRQAALAVPAERLATFLQGRIRAEALRHFNLRFASPDRAIVTAEARVGGQFVPVRLEGQLVATGGKLGFKPLALTGPIKGFDLRWRPQDQRVELDATDQQLMDLLLPKLKTRALTDVRWHLVPGSRVEAEAKVTFARHTGELHVVAGLGASDDHKLQITAQEARLRWRGLDFTATPPDGRARITGTDAAVLALLQDELDTDKVKLESLVFTPGNGFEARGMALEGGQYRPITLEGRFSAKDGGLYVAPEKVAISQARGGLDVTFHPQTGTTEGTITEATLNGLLGPAAAKSGFEELSVKLLANDRFTLEGFKVDRQKNPPERKRVKIEGKLALSGEEAVRLNFEKIKYGGLTVDFDHLHVKLLQAVGLHLDDILKIDEPFAKLEKDTLFFYPGRVSDKVQGRITALDVSAGRLSVKAAIATDMRTLLPFKHQRFTFDGKGFLFTPKTVGERAAGTVTGVRTGNGTLELEARITAADLQHIIRLKSDEKVDFRGDRAILDPNKLQSHVEGRVLGVTTGEGKATVELAVDAEDAAQVVPGLPRGLDFNGRVITAPVSAIDSSIQGAITGVKVENGELVVQVGEPGRRAEGNQAAGTLKGAMVVSGITIEDAEAELVDRTPGTPLDPRNLKDGDLFVKRGKAFIPRERAESLLAELLAKRDLKGFAVRYAPGGLAVEGQWKGIPVTGQVRVGAAGEGLGLAASDVKIWKIPVPGWAATWLAGKLAGLPAKDGQLMLDVGGLAGVKLGPVKQVEAGADGIRLRIGD